MGSLRVGCNRVSNTFSSLTSPRCQESIRRVGSWTGSSCTDSWELAIFNGESHRGAQLVWPNEDLSFSIAISMKSLLIDDRILIQGEGVPGGSDNKESACSVGDLSSIDSWVEKIPWRRAWQPTPVFLFGESHRQRSLAGYSLRGHKRVGHDLVTKQQQRSFND